jgi:DtxR family Mn-dependent transcriptional regulator
VSDLIDTTEMYLRTILELEEDGVVPMRARIVELLGQAGPTVSQTISRMQRDGLVELASDRSLRLTPAGRERAVSVLRRHRLAERLLVDVIGLDLHLVHAEACRWEHVMSEDVERRVLALVPDPTVSPFGNPVPGLGALGAPEAPAPAPGRDSVAVRDLGSVAAVRVVRFGEPLQADHALLGALLRAGVDVGATCRLVAAGDGARVVGGAQGEVTLRDPLTRHLMVWPLTHPG